MNAVDFDKKKFDADGYGNLTPKSDDVKTAKQTKTWSFGDSLADVLPNKSKRKTA